jgi:hypothetical protein
MSEMGQDSVTDSKAFLEVFPLRQIGFQEKTRSKIGLEPGRRNPVSLPVLKFPDELHSIQIRILQVRFPWES